MLGISSNLNLLMICHCFRESDSIIRIISARKATKNESKFYTGEKTMKEEYDLAKMKSRKNPYANKLRKQITLRVGIDVIDFFKEMSEKTGIPYQSLINLYLRDCAAKKKELNLNWIENRSAA